MAISFNNVRSSIDGIKSVVISSIEPDPATGGFVRVISLYTDPASALGRRAILEVVLTSMEQSTLEITTPPQSY